jgi:hypothetical protein
MLVDWQNFILGALAGILIPYFIKSIIYVYRRIYIKNWIEGEWHCYFYSNHNEDRTLKLVNAKIFINKGLLHRYTAIEKREGENIIKYKGTVVFESNGIVLKLDASNYDEYVVFRLYGPLPTSNMLLHGLQLSLDIKRNPYCGAVIVSQKSIEEEQVKAQFEQFYSFMEIEKVISSTH